MTVAAKRIRKINQLGVIVPPPTEFDIHASIADALRIEIGPPGRLGHMGVVWFSTDISNSASRYPGARQRRGIVAGIPDLFLIYRGHTYAMEIKRPDDGVLSDSQQEVLAAASLAGMKAAIVTGAKEALEMLDEWRIPRKHRFTFGLG